jgi:CRP-like cAMP-binding protein
VSSKSRSGLPELASAGHPELAGVWDELSAMWKRIEVPAGRVLLREGDVSRRAYMVERGCLRLWFMHGTKDITFQFFFEGEVVSSMESFRKGTPSPFTLETIEPCALHVFDRAQFATMMAHVAEHPPALLRLLEAAYERQAHYMRIFLSFIRDTPAQRYANLVKDEPRIVQRVAQRYIASYLGITPVSLSRIRARAARRS